MITLTEFQRIVSYLLVQCQISHLPDMQAIAKKKKKRSRIGGCGRGYKWKAD